MAPASGILAAKEQDKFILRGIPQWRWSGVVRSGHGHTFFSRSSIVDNHQHKLKSSVDITTSSGISCAVRHTKCKCWQDMQRGILELQLQETFSYWETDVNPWTGSCNQLKEGLTRSLSVEVPVQDYWRLGYLSKLITQRREARTLGLDDEEGRVTALINSLVKN